MSKENRGPKIDEEAKKLKFSIKLKDREPKDVAREQRAINELNARQASRTRAVVDAFRRSGGIK